jgi:hypothetical protein
LRRTNAFNSPGRTETDLGLYDGFPYRGGTARIRRWAGFIDEPESSKESRLRAWSVLRQLRSVLPRLETSRFHHRLRRCRGRNLGTRFDEIPDTSERGGQSLCSSVRRFRDSTLKEECKRDYPQALQALVESPRSGGGSDSELGPMCGRYRRPRRRKSLRSGNFRHWATDASARLPFRRSKFLQRDLPTSRVRRVLLDTVL